ncbi:L-rhamnose mutarotase [Sphingobacterium griseoflavum]|uniref:L-fucose mutarotase n=1 Tax=Sphingobacterium griseoflavum TaxID=1474952 RepID=A0ABQ3HY15_9SPHI|nr:L-rhamnose mutarotase [Sphingobacterium griseoflavum]GHE31484.1 L-fucose mutarotase [Sphingobacterium griseoflavum]
MRRFALALDLVDDPQLIDEYERYHKSLWPEIKASILDAGIGMMEIYRFSNRLVMIMEVDDEFSFSRKAEMDQENPKVQEWEELMWTYQRAIPGAKPGEKWVMMDKIFELEK